ncbi:MAG: urea amidolyase family protein [Micropruina sp.]|uniref:5-oxoprolinase subunit B/C family protein n=1 Tax=Micropruina sp. TaxID=2737536 RepID=UPI0039E3E9BC
MDGRLLPCGERAVLIEVDDLDAVLALRAALAERAGHGDFAAVRDVVPAATTVLLGVDGPSAPPRVRAAASALLAELDDTPIASGRIEPVEIGVRYDGEDLAEVARLTGLDPASVIAAHTGSEWTVAFGGFAPGFAYLVGGDDRLHVPRRAEPRTRVPAGAVGLAGPFSGIYPRPSPGGWQLIGRTDVELWDADREPPALLQPGGRVRFRDLDADRPGPDAIGGPSSPSIEAGAIAPIERSNEFPREQIQPGLDKLDQRNPAQQTVAQPGLDHRKLAPDKGDQHGHAVRSGLTVLVTGPLTLPVDEGRPGYAALGVGASGAADRASYRLGNRLVGNPPGLPSLEITMGGLAVRAEETCLIALTGADCAPVVDGRRVTHGGPVYLRAGQELRLGLPTAGLRTYLSVAGGFDVPLVLGSASTDTLSGVGPSCLYAGDTLAVRRPEAPSFLTVESTPHPLLPDAELLLDVLPGPRADWLAEPSALVRQQWRVSDRSDRVGVRLLGDALARHPSVSGRELPSEAMVRGGIQVPPDGRPVVFGVDHPVTGGYPVVGVLTEAASDLLAQARPGDRVSFRPRGW